MTHFNKLMYELCDVANQSLFYINILSLLFIHIILVVFSVEEHHLNYYHPIYGILCKGFYLAKIKFYALNVRYVMAS